MRAYQFITEYSRSATIGNPNVAQKLIDRFMSGDARSYLKYRSAQTFDMTFLIPKFIAQLNAIAQQRNPTQETITADINSLAQTNESLKLFNFDLSKLKEYARQLFASDDSFKANAYFRVELRNLLDKATRNLSIDKQKLLDFVATEIEKTEPKVNDRYLPWLFREYINGNIQRIEDTSAARANLLLYDANKRRSGFPQEAKDIMRLTADQLRQVVLKYNPDDPQNIAQNMGTYEIVYGSMDVQQDEVGTPKPIITSDYVVIHPQDKAAALYFGRVLGGMTNWCTAYIPPLTNRFDEYNKQGPLYIIIPANPKRKGEKLQIHLSSGQFMDENDKPVDPRGLFNEFSEFKKILNELTSGELDNLVVMCDDKTLYDVHRTVVNYLDIVAREAYKELDRDEREMSGSVGESLKNVVRTLSKLKLQPKKIRKNAEGLSNITGDPVYVDSMVDLVLFEVEQDDVHAILELDIWSRVIVTLNQYLEGHLARIVDNDGTIRKQKTIGNYTVILKD